MTQRDALLILARVAERAYQASYAAELQRMRAESDARLRDDLIQLTAPVLAALDAKRGMVN